MIRHLINSLVSLMYLPESSELALHFVFADTVIDLLTQCLPTDELRNEHLQLIAASTLQRRQTSICMYRVRDWRGDSTGGVGAMGESCLLVTLEASALGSSSLPKCIVGIDKLLL